MMYLLGGGIVMLRFGKNQSIDFLDLMERYQDIIITVGGILLIIILIIIFISSRRKMKKQEKILQNARIQEEKYRILAEISNDILFEYDIFSDTMNFSDKFLENFGRKGSMERFAELKEEAQFIHKDDTIAFENFCKLLGGEKQKLEVEFRMKRLSGDYVWCYVCGQTIYNAAYEPLKIVGKLSNIDMQKREVEKLQFKAEMDAMTRIYNKVATRERINALIQNSRKQDKHALLIVDMDNFKKINDTFGHLKGDEVLKEGVEHLKNMFRGDDIIGRIGGDEFAAVAIVKEEAMGEQIRDRIILASKMFNQISDKPYYIEVSIGYVVFRWESSLELNQMLSKADYMLYESKAHRRKTIQKR